MAQHAGPEELACLLTLQTGRLQYCSSTLEDFLKHVNLGRSRKAPYLTKRTHIAAHVFTNTTITVTILEASKNWGGQAALITLGSSGLVAIATLQGPRGVDTLCACLPQRCPWGREAPPFACPALNRCVTECQCYPELTLIAAGAIP